MKTKKKRPQKPNQQARKPRDLKPKKDVKGGFLTPIGGVGPHG